MVPCLASTVVILLWRILSVQVPGSWPNPSAFLELCNQSVTSPALQQLHYVGSSMKLKLISLCYSQSAPPWLGTRDVQWLTVRNCSALSPGGRHTLTIESAPNQPPLLPIHNEPITHFHPQEKWSTIMN